MKKNKNKCKFFTIKNCPYVDLNKHPEMAYIQGKNILEKKEYKLNEKRDYI